MAAAASGVRAGKAYVELGVDSSALAKGLNAAASKLKAFGAGISNIGKGLMAAGTAVTAPLTLMAKSFADGGSRMLEMSKRTGVSVEALSALGYAAERSGADMDSLEAGLRKMQRSIFAAANGSASAQESFSLLGLDIAKLVQMNPEQQFKAVADALAGIQDPTLRAAMAMQILGRGGTALLPMMEQGAAGIEMMEQKAKELGLISSTQTAQSAKSLSLAFSDFASVSKKTGSILGSALADTLRETTQWLTDLIVKLNAFIKTHKDVVVAVFKVAKVVFAVGAGLFILGIVVSKVGAGLAILAKIVTIGISVFGVMGSILAWLLSPIGLVITAVVALGAFILYATGLGGKALDWLAEKFSGLFEDATAAWQGIGDALAAGDIGLAARILWLTLKMEWNKGVAYLQSIWLEFKQWFIKIAYGAFYGVQAAWEIASHALVVAWIETTAFLSKVWTNFSAGVQSAWDSVTGWVSDRMLDLQGVVDSSFDAEKAKQYNQQQSQANQAGIEQDRQGKLNQIESERAAKHKAESDQHEQELAKLGQGYNDAVNQAAAENASGSDVPRFGVLGIDEPIFTPGDDLDAFKDRVALVGVTPKRKDHFGRFVILLEPIVNGGIGRAYAAGVCPVKLNIPEDGQELRFADVTDGSTGTLTAGPQGAAFILWKEDAGSSGEVWAVVRLVAPVFRFYALDDCEEEKPTLYVTNDLADSVGKVVLVEGTCYTVRVPDDDEVSCLAPNCVEIKEKYEDCDRCKGCWELTPCDESGTAIKTNRDLAQYEGMVVQLEDGQCYTVSLADDCLDAEPVEVKEWYEDCESCGHCYHLQNCFDETDTLVIDNDLAREFEQTPEQIVADGRVVEISGQCYTVVGYDTDCPDVQTVALGKLFPSCGDCGCFKLTVCNSDPLEEIYARKATGHDGSNVSLRDYVGKTIRLSDGKCYTVEESSECDELQDVVLQEAVDDCDSCVCWELVDCEESEPTIVTFSDLSKYGAGAIVKDAATGKCWTITQQTDWVPEAVAFQVEQDYPDCDACLGNRLYTLTQSCSMEECDDGGRGSGDQIVTKEDLHAAVGMYVKVGGKCYSVAEGGGEVTDESLSHQGPFASCDDCLEAAVDSEITVLTDLSIDGTDLVAATQTLVIRGGKIVGVCDSDEIRLEGTDCPDGDTTSGSAGGV